MGGTFSLPGATDPESGGKRQGIIHNTQHASALSRARYGDPVKPRGVPLCLGLCLCLCVYVSVCASPLFFTYTQRHVPKQPHNWDKCHTDTDDNILKGTDIEIHKKELQLRLLLPFKDRVRWTVVKKEARLSCMFLNAAQLMISSRGTYYMFWLRQSAEHPVPSTQVVNDLGEAMEREQDHMGQFIASVFQSFLQSFFLTFRSSRESSQWFISSVFNRVPHLRKAHWCDFFSESLPSKNPVFTKNPTLPPSHTHVSSHHCSTSRCCTGLSMKNKKV